MSRKKNKKKSKKSMPGMKILEKKDGQHRGYRQDTSIVHRHSPNILPIYFMATEFCENP